MESTDDLDLGHVLLFSSAARVLYVPTSINCKFRSSTQWNCFVLHSLICCNEIDVDEDETLICLTIHIFELFQGGTSPISKLRSDVAALIFFFACVLN